MKSRAQEKPAKSLAPPRVRFEPATVDEAVHAARGLTSDIDQQVDIAAGLIGLDHNEVRDHVLRLQQSPLDRAEASDGRTRVVVVERRGAGLARERRRVLT